MHASAAKVIALMPLLSSAACGAPMSLVKALEQRVDTLSQKLDTMQAQIPPDTEQRLAAVEQQAKASAEGLEEAVGPLKQQVLELLAATQTNEDGATDGSRYTLNASRGLPVSWMIDSALGKQIQGVKAEGTRYEIDRAWLLGELHALAIEGKGPRLMEKKGALHVRGVRPNSLAAALGLKNGDVITAIGQTTVSSVDQLADALKSLNGPAEVHLQRSRKDTVLTYTLSEAP